MDTELQSLLLEVDAYLAATGIPPTKFGILTVNDRAVLIRMRQGRAVTSRNMSLMRQFMAANPPPMSSISRIKDALHITQTEMAAIFGCDQSTISRWERGVDPPRFSFDDLKKLRDEFERRGVPWSEDFLFGSPDNTSSVAAE